MRGDGGDGGVQLLSGLEPFVVHVGDVHDLGRRDRQRVGRTRGGGRGPEGEGRLEEWGWNCS